MAVSLKHQTITGVFWNFLELFLRRGVTGLTTLVLAWFLVPKDFGLVSMMTVFLAFSHVIVDGGMKQGLIRKQDVTQTEYSTAFYANLACALMIYAALYAAAPFIADFYVESALTDLIRVAGLTVIFNAFSVVQEAVLNRRLKFKELMKVSFPAALISGAAAIVMAYQDFGVWVLVLQMLSSAALVALFYWRLGLWQPTLEFSGSAFRQLFRFGGYLLLAQMTNVPYRHMYVIVIAKFFSAQVAGYYFFAEKIKELLLSQLVASIETVTYPALARLQDDPARLKQGYRQVIAATTFLLFPLLIFLAALSDNLFRLMLPEQWLPASVYLQFMCFAALLYPLHSINLNILKVKGRSDLVFYLGLYKKTVAIGIFFVSYHYGIIGILLGQTVSSVLAYLPNSFFSKRLIGYSVREQLVDFIPGLILSGLIGFGLWQMEKTLPWHDLPKIAVLAGVGMTLYLLGASIFKLSAYRLANEMIMNRFKGKSKQ